MSPSGALSRSATGERLRAAAKNLGMRAAGRVGVGLDRVLGGRAGGAAAILTYHRVASPPKGLPSPLHNVPPERFRAQIAGLKRRGFRIVSLSRLLELRAAASGVPPHTVVVTFDDGYASVHANAWPVLRELEAPASVFLATAYLDAEAPFPFDAWGCAHRDHAPPESYRPLRSEECLEMLASGWIELGCHSHTHRDFRGRPEALARDVETSLGVLRERFGLEPVPFAFPYGSPRLGYTREDLVAAVRGTGVSCALSTESAHVEPNTDPFSWGRFNVFSWDTPATLAAKLEGWYSWGPRAWQRLTRALAS